MEILSELARYRVCDTTPGETDRSSMPLGNGEIGVNIWTTRDGGVELYFSRSDAFDYLGRNKKLGKVRVEFTPNPFPEGQPFCQTLCLDEGCVEIMAGTGPQQFTLRVFVQQGEQRIYLVGHSAQPLKTVVTYSNWRCLPENTAPADHLLATPQGLAFYYRDNRTSVPEIARLEGLEDAVDKIYDPFLHRIFGGVITMADAVAEQPDAAHLRLTSREKAEDFSIVITTGSHQTEDAAHWLETLWQLAERTPAPADAWQQTKSWWESYWRQSWVFVQGDAPHKRRMTESLQTIEREPATDFGENVPLPQGLSMVTRAYLLTKYMFACNATGAMPLYFNGLLFNTMPGENSDYNFNRFGEIHTAKPVGEPTVAVNPDCRCWSGNVMWQNVRLPYYSMLARNETEAVRGLFRFYRRFWALNRERAKRYYNAKGQYNTEMTMFSGLLHPWIYGENREGKPLGYAENRWGGAVDISPGLELACLMVAYYHHTQDKAFLQEEALVYAKELFAFIETRFPRRENGKIVLAPLQCVETYWDTENPVTVVAGMQALAQMILRLPENLVADRAYFCRMAALTPAIPLEKRADGTQTLAPAKRYDTTPHNVEPVGLYTVYPFQNFTAYQQNCELARRYYRDMQAEKQDAFAPRIIGDSPSVFCCSGWQYIGCAAALLGLTEEAAKILADNVAVTNPGYRFPAMWGPVYDAVPDVDHGANILNMTQLMLMQVAKKKIYLLPAWPREWDVHFKLYADAATTVECVVRDGAVAALTVTPESRRQDVVLPLWQ